MERTFQMQLAGRPLVIETGKLAQFANGSCLVRYGDTVILCTVTASAQPRPGTDYFPLSVDYEERQYSVGKIPGGFIKREGRPTEKAILTSRCIDRPIRPLFPKDLRNDVVVSTLVMSVDQDNSPEVAAMIGSSVAIAISDIPWNGPVAGIHLGLIDGRTVINPNEQERLDSQMLVTLAGTEEKICMIEAGANEVADDVMLQSIADGHEVIRDICRFIKDITTEIGKPKFTYQSVAVPSEIFDTVYDYAYERMKQAVLTEDKSVRDSRVAELQQEVAVRLAELNPEWEAGAGDAIDKLEKLVVREYLAKERRRVDGRRLDEIRPLEAAVGLLPRVHGSGLFQRGQTQVVTACTLGSLSKAQMLDGLDNEEQKRYMHHYNFPGYSTGEAKMSRSPGRREIGHGALAERALVPVLPTEEDFPYAIRCVSEVIMSNGSTSQGSVCASTLALMDAGVPISRPVAGISCGLLVDEENPQDYITFMDIQGLEDFYGDMDFKVAGTTEGITAIQVDIKVDGLTLDIIRDAFAMTRKGRLQIIHDVLLPVLPEPRAELSPYAPKITQIVIPVDKIREVIGSGGKVINKIIEETGVEIDIEDDGRVFIASPNSAASDKALSMINGIVHDPEPGQVFDGKVTRLMTFGAFVEFLPGKEGLVHISKMAWNHVGKVEDVVKEGDPVRVKVIEIDSQGRINLSMRDLMEKPEGYVEPEPGSERRGARSGGDRGGRGGFDRGNRSGYDRGGRGGSDRGNRGGYDRGGDRGDRFRDRGDRPVREPRSFGESGFNAGAESGEFNGPQQRNTRDF